MTVGAVSYWTILHFWQRILAIFGWAKYVFFDKVCIHQSDMGLKSRGIANITGVLANSKELLVALDPSYFTRLWCPFEVAAFLHAHPQGSVVAVPVKLGHVAAFASLGGFTTMILVHFVADLRGHTVGQVQLF